MDIFSRISGVRPTFQRRGIPIAAEFRPRWKMGCVVLCIGLAGRGRVKKITDRKLRILVWCSRSSATQEALIAYVNGRMDPTEPILRHEPSYVAAFNLLMGLGIISPLMNECTQLTASGNKLFTVINDDPELFLDEKEFIGSIKNKVTNEVIASLSGISN